MSNDPMIPYGAGLSMEQRLARLEQRLLDKSIGTEAGAMIGFDGAGVPVELPAAPGDGYTRISDSSQSGGVKWASPVRDVLAMQAAAYQAAGAGAATYVLNADSAMSAPTGCGNCPLFKYTAADWVLDDGTYPKFYIVSTITPNGTGPGGTHTCYLSQLASLGGGAGGISVTYTGSPPLTNSHGTVTAGNVSMVKSGTAVSLTDGQVYHLTYANSNTIAANSFFHVRSMLYATYDA